MNMNMNKQDVENMEFFLEEAVEYKKELRDKCPQMNRIMLMDKVFKLYGDDGTNDCRYIESNKGEKSGRY